MNAMKASADILFSPPTNVVGNTASMIDEFT